jgi:hypothetical protein
VDVKTSVRLLIGLLVITALAPSSWSQATRSRYDPAASERPSKSREGFFDFTLKRINPSNRDYGEMIALRRNLLLVDSLENRHFWSNVVCLGLLGCLFILVVFQHKHLTRAEWKTAEILAQYEHALKRANVQVAEATRRNSEIVEALVGLKESTVSAQPARTNNNETPVARPSRTRSADTPANAIEPPKNGTNKPVKAAAIPTKPVAGAGAQIALFKPDLDLMTRVNSLEQLLAQSREHEKELVRHLNEAERKLQTEQDKNRNLKGG